MARIATNHQNPGEKHETDSPLEPPEGTSVADMLLISEFKKINFCYLNHPVCGTLLWQLLGN